MRAFAFFLLVVGSQPVAAQVVTGGSEFNFTITSACTAETITGTMSCTQVAGVAGERDLTQAQCQGSAVGTTSGNLYVISEVVVFGSRLDFERCRGNEYLDLKVRLMSHGAAPDEVFRFRERVTLEPENEFICRWTSYILDWQTECRGHV